MGDLVFPQRTVHSPVGVCSRVTLRVWDLYTLWVPPFLALAGWGSVPQFSHLYGRDNKMENNGDSKELLRGESHNYY